MGKKNVSQNGLLRIIILLLCILAVAMGIFFAYLKLRSDQELVQTSSDNAALYDDVVTADLFDKYPATPEEVMAFYDKTVLLLYDPALDNPDMLQKILSKQRALYAETLLELNDFDSQFENLLASRKALAKSKITIARIEHPSSYFDQTPQGKDIFVVNTIQYINGEANLYFNFDLQQDAKGNWKILARESTNANFMDMVNIPVETIE